MALHEEAKEFLSRGYGLAAETVSKRHLVPKSMATGVIAGLAGVGLRAGSEALLEHRAWSRGVPDQLGLQELLSEHFLEHSWRH